MRQAILTAQVLLLTFVCGLFTACDSSVDAGSVPLTGRASVGQLLPVFSSLSHEGRSQPFVRPKTHLLVLNLWAIWCPPCREEMPSLQRLADSYDTVDLQVIGLAIEEDAFLLDEFLRKYQITFPVQRISREQAEPRLGLREYPLTLLIAADGRVLARLSGAFDWDDPRIKTLLRQVVQTQKISHTEIDAVFRANQKAAAESRRKP